MKKVNRIKKCQIFDCYGELVKTYFEPQYMVNWFFFTTWNPYYEHHSSYGGSFKIGKNFDSIEEANAFILDENSKIPAKMTCEIVDSKPLSNIK